MIKKKISFKDMHATEAALSGLGLNTVCHQARCPNISECYHRGTATFLIMGGSCTRDCSFCNVTKGTPLPLDKSEPERIAEAVKRLKLSYSVITSVTRDDLPDGGASHFAETVMAVKKNSPMTKIELLIPDFGFNTSALDSVITSEPHVLAHNVETVPSLYHVRKGADYKRSLNVLTYSKKKAPSLLTKSAIMLGLGETEKEVAGVFHDLRKAGCDFLSIGQYLSPGKKYHPVAEYISEEKFSFYKNEAINTGFRHVESGPWVRSSYMADTYHSAP